MDLKMRTAMKKFKSLLLLLGGLFLTFPGFAQNADGNWMEALGSMKSSQLTLLIILVVVLGVILLLLILMVYLMSFLSSVLKKQNPKFALSEEQAPSWLESFKVKYVTGKRKSIEEEKDIMLDHSYDGIVELDNFMPPWLKYVFYFSIAFAFIYVGNYLVLGIGKTQYEEYDEELRLASIQKEKYQALALGSIDETNVLFDKSGPAIKSGQTIYENNCVACHASDGGGGVGPNLTDDYWIHGGSIQDVFKVIKYGVPEKGMIPWQDQLSPEEMQQVSSFILTLVGNTSANPKEPQGELYEAVIEKPIDALTEEGLGVEIVEQDTVGN